MSVTIRGTDNSASTPAVSGTDGDTGVFFPAANTVAIATNGTEKGRFDSNGALIMGATTLNPTNANCVYIYPPDSTVRFTNTSATTREWTIGTSAPGVSGAGDYFAITRYSGSAWSQYLTVDESGRVLTPNQPAFRVSSTTNQTISSGTPTVIQSNNEQFDIGSNFNTSTYRFTVPVSGRYLFTMMIQFQGAVTQPHTTMSINGSSQEPWIDWGGSTSTAAFQSRVMSLSAGDFAQLYTYIGSGSGTTDGGRCVFSGFLIG